MIFKPKDQAPVAVPSETYLKEISERLKEINENLNSIVEYIVEKEAAEFKQKHKKWI